MTMNPIRPGMSAYRPALRFGDISYDEVQRGKPVVSNLGAPYFNNKSYLIPFAPIEPELMRWDPSHPQHAATEARFDFKWSASDKMDIYYVPGVQVKVPVQSKDNKQAWEKAEVKTGHFWFRFPKNEEGRQADKYIDPVQNDAIAEKLMELPQVKTLLAENGESQVINALRVERGQPVQEEAPVAPAVETAEKPFKEVERTMRLKALVLPVLNMSLEDAIAVLLGRRGREK